MYFIIIVIFLMLVLYDWCRYESRVFKKMPGPRAWPFIGNVWGFVQPPDKLFSYLRHIHKTYGNFSQIHCINFQAVNIYEPGDVEKVLSSVKHNDKKQPYTFVKPWLGEGLLISNGSKWHQRRKLLTSAFHLNILKKYAMTFNSETEHFLNAIEIESKREKTDIVPLVHKTTLRVMCETSMGISISTNNDSVVDNYFEGLHIFIHSFIERICRTWLYFDYIFIFTSMFWKQKTAVKDLHKFTNMIISERKAKRQKNEEDSRMDVEDNIGMSKRGKLAMLDLLLTKEQEGAIDLRGIREEVDTFLFEGHDTTASAICFMLMTFANEDKIQKKLYEEMFSIFGDSDRSATMEDLHEMKYLDCCIKESLRLYPSVPLIARHITNEIVLSGYKVPPKTICHVFVYDMHRRADLYPDPEKFIPERFLPENSQNRHPYAYIPFSAGPRNCIGSKFAMLEMKTLLSGLIRRYILEPITKPDEITFTTDMVLRPVDPIYVRFRKRE